jgi:hypothetical protein
VPHTIATSGKFIAFPSFGVIPQGIAASTTAPPNSRLLESVRF